MPSLNFHIKGILFWQIIFVLFKYSGDFSLVEVSDPYSLEGTNLKNSLICGAEVSENLSINWLFKWPSMGADIVWL